MSCDRGGARVGASSDRALAYRRGAADRASGRPGRGGYHAALGCIVGCARGAICDRRAEEQLRNLEHLSALERPPAANGCERGNRAAGRACTTNRYRTCKVRKAERPPEENGC